MILLLTGGLIFWTAVGTSVCYCFLRSRIRRCRPGITTRVNTVVVEPTSEQEQPLNQALQMQVCLNVLVQYVI